MPGFILAENILESASVFREDSQAGYPIANAFDGRTATKSAIDGTVITANRFIFDLATPTEADCVCISGHNAADLTQVLVTVYYSDDNVSFYSAMPSEYIVLTDNKAGYHTFDLRSHRYWEIRITPTGSTDFYFSDVSLGKRKDLERSQKHGFTKPEFVDNDQITPNLTRGQNLAGLTVKAMPRRVKFDFFYYTEAFFSDWENIIARMKVKPVYILWDDAKQVFYCWPSKKMPQPSYAKNIFGYYNVKLDMTGFIE